MLYPIDEQLEFNIRKHAEYLQTHKGATIDNKPRMRNYTVKYCKETDKSSAGFRILLKTVPRKSYNLKISARLITGDRAFIYCESLTGHRLIPRTYFFTPSLEQEYDLDFTATSDRTYVGVLFFYGQTNYHLDVNQLKISTIEVKRDYKKLQKLKQHKSNVTHQQQSQKTGALVNQSQQTQTVQSIQPVNQSQQVQPQQVQPQQVQPQQVQPQQVQPQQVQPQQVQPQQVQPQQAQPQPPKKTNVLLKESRSRGTRFKRIEVQPERVIKGARKDLKKRDWKYSTEAQPKNYTEYDSSDSSDVLNFDALIEKYNKLKAENLTNSTISMTNTITNTRNNNMTNKTNTTQSHRKKKGKRNKTAKSHKVAATDTNITSVTNLSNVSGGINKPDIGLTTNNYHDMSQLSDSSDLDSQSFGRIRKNKKIKKKRHRPVEVYIEPIINYNSHQDSAINENKSTDIDNMSIISNQEKDIALPLLDHTYQDDQQKSDLIKPKPPKLVTEDFKKSYHENFRQRESNNYNNESTISKPKRVVISLSTPYFELNKLKNVIKKLGELTCQCNQIYINIPYNFSDNLEEKFHEEPTGDLELPFWLGKASVESSKLNLRVNRCPNWGPLTKLLGVLPLETEEDTIIVLLTPTEDDLLIDDNLIDELINNISRNPKSAWSCHGFYKNNYANEVQLHRNTGQLLALATNAPGLVCRRDFFKKNINKIKEIPLRDLINYSDLILSSYLVNHDISIGLCGQITANSKNNLIKSLKNKIRLTDWAKIVEKYDFLSLPIASQVLINEYAGRSPIDYNTNSNQDSKQHEPPKLLIPSIINHSIRDKQSLQAVSEQPKEKEELKQKYQIQPPNQVARINTYHSLLNRNFNKRITTGYLSEYVKMPRKPPTPEPSITISDVVFKNQEFPQTPSYNSKIAVIVEPRNDDLLPALIKHFIDILAKYSWKFQIFHGTENEQLLKMSPELTQAFKNGLLVLNKMEVTNLTRSQYSRLLLHKEFYQMIQGENILIFQLDSCLNRNSQFKIERFLDYDYVGAPWALNMNQRSLINSRNRIHVGNGGLSFRKRSTMIKVTELLHQKYQYLLDKNEDLVISSLLSSPEHFRNANIPDHKLAKKFAIEMIYEQRSFGIHRAWDYLSKREFEQLKKDCPDMVELFKDKYF